MDKFTDKFGWERGTALMCKTARKSMFFKYVYQLNEKEEAEVVKNLRKVYRNIED